jgi:hypothetical protein
MHRAELHEALFSGVIAEEVLFPFPSDSRPA